MRLLVTVTNPEGTAIATSAPTAEVGDGPVSTIAPAVNGTARRGSTLSAVAGTWSGNANAYASSGSARPTAV